MLQPGKYRAKPIFGEWLCSRNGNEFVRVCFQILDAQLSASNDAPEASIDARFFFTQSKNTEISIRALKACGCIFPNNDITDLSGLGNHEVELVVAHQEYNGFTSPTVKWVNSLSKPSRNAAMSPFKKAELTSQQAVAIRQRLKGTLLQDKSAAAVTVSATNEDIPF